MEKLSEGIKQYANNLDALREFVEVLAPVLQERSLLGMKKNKAAIDPLLPMLEQIKAQAQDGNEIDSDLMGTINEELKILCQILLLQRKQYITISYFTVYHLSLL